MPLRAIPATLGNLSLEPGWMGSFLASLSHDDLAPATLRGYRYDLRHFLSWHATVQEKPFAIEGAPAAAGRGAAWGSVRGRGGNSLTAAV